MWTTTITTHYEKHHKTNSNHHNTNSNHQNRQKQKDQKHSGSAKKTPKRTADSCERHPQCFFRKPLGTPTWFLHSTLLRELVIDVAKLSGALTADEASKCVPAVLTLLSAVMLLSRALVYVWIGEEETKSKKGVETICELQETPYHHFLKVKCDSWQMVVLLSEADTRQKMKEKHSTHPKSSQWTDACSANGVYPLWEYWLWQQKSVTEVPQHTRQM